MKSFIIDTFPALDNPEGYDSMFADSNKTLHLIPAEINTPAKLKSYATGRSALYIRPKSPISLAGSYSSSYGTDNDACTTSSASGSHQATTTQTISLPPPSAKMSSPQSIQSISSPPINLTETSLLPPLDVVVMTDETYSIPTVS